MALLSRLSAALSLSLALSTTAWALTPTPGGGPPSHSHLNKTNTALPPSQDPFYAMPGWARNVEPGTILRHRHLPSNLSAFGQPLDSSLVQYSQQILYRTTGHHGTPISSVLTVLVPPNADYGKVVSLQVAEDTASVDCAPSFGFLAAVADYPQLESPTVQVHLLMIQALLDRRWIVIVPDTAGPRAVYPPSKPAAHAVLDGVRAALNSNPFTQIHRNASVALWGYSGGGAETMAAVQVRPSYAPDLLNNVVGAALGGTTAPTTREAPSAAESLAVLNKGPSASFIPVTLLGLTAYSSRLRQTLNSLLKPESRAQFYLPLHQCHDANKRTFKDQDILSLFVDRQRIMEFFTGVLDSTAKFDWAPQSPQLYWYQLASDHLIDPQKISQVVQRWCSLGSHIEFQLETSSRYTHAAYGLIAVPSVLRWLSGVLEGTQLKGQCTNSTVLTPRLDPSFLNLFPETLQTKMVGFVGGE
ncbi:hypothetical protein CP533_0025 [Ophiocordyceps camponoti-saundersi (nom. inval.)]|nr:hypothetical protein CP533_0025 [Ophiocordyceps camponoti-saundersi (nom. inval.)]